MATRGTKPSLTELDPGLDRIARAVAAQAERRLRDDVYQETWLIEVPPDFAVFNKLDETSTYTVLPSQRTRAENRSPDSHHIFPVQFAAMAPALQKRRAAQVLRTSDGFDMCGVNASAVAAEVVRLQAIRNGADQRLIAEAMGKDQFPGPIRSATYPEVTVAPLDSRPHPFPATVLKDANLGPEARRQSIVAKSGGGKIGLHREPTPLGVTQPVVTRHAAAFILTQC